MLHKTYVRETNETRGEKGRQEKQVSGHQAATEVQLQDFRR